MNFMVFLCFSIFIHAPLVFAKGDHGHHHHKMGFKDAKKWTQAFDDPSRDEWQKPKELIAALGVSPNAVIGDLGAGTGYFSARIAKQFPQSTVYAIDNEPDMIQFLKERAQKESLANLHPVLSLEDGFTVDKKLDLLLIVDTYHHLPNREKYFAKIKEHLKPSARIVIVDFLLDSPVGPPKKYRFQPPQIQKELQAAGFKNEKVLQWPRQFVLFLKQEELKTP